MNTKNWHGISGIIKLVIRQTKIHILLRLGQVLPHSNLRVLCFKLMGVNIGKHVFIGLDCIFDYLFPEKIFIDDYAEIGDRACIYSHSRGSIPLLLKYPLKVEEVHIKKGVWIGAPNVTVLPGVTIGEHSIIGAGAVVVKDIPANVLAGGVPAKTIKKLINHNDEL